MSGAALVTLSLVAFVAGAFNSVAGGGGFLAFPTLVFFGVPPLSANATNTLALWPGSVGAAAGYVKQLRAPSLAKWLWPFVAVSAAGGVGGAVLLVKTPESLFEKALPFLLLFATLVFTFGRALVAKVGKRPGGLPLPVGLVAMAPIALYGGYFGGGMGFMMLALFSLLDLPDIHAMNALKSLLAAVANAFALASFALAGIVAWHPGLLMTVFALAGGYFGARFVTKLPPEPVRRAVVLVSWVMTAAFFVRAFG